MGGRNTRVRVSEPVSGLSGRIRTLQRGSKTFNAGGSPGATSTQTITSVELGHSVARHTGASIGSSGTHQGNGGCRLTDATTITFRAQSSSGVITTSHNYEVVERWP